ncbi:MAG: hypothetical protein LBK82_10445 [Planctomycetaceae bacterium]|nr:hypothetical protein [Planctomycetaceae bacterium]
MLKGRVGVSRLVLCFRQTTGFQNSRQSQIAAVKLVHCRLTPTRPFSERSPTLWLPNILLFYF